MFSSLQPTPESEFAVLLNVWKDLFLLRLQRWTRTSLNIQSPDWLFLIRTDAISFYTTTTNVIVYLHVLVWTRKSSAPSAFTCIEMKALITYFHNDPPALVHRWSRGGLVQAEHQQQYWCPALLSLNGDDLFIAEAVLSDKQDIISHLSDDYAARVTWLSLNWNHTSEPVLSDGRTSAEKARSRALGMCR